jgi:hypothetical protein
LAPTKRKVQGYEHRGGIDGNKVVPNVVEFMFLSNEPGSMRTGFLDGPRVGRGYAILGPYKKPGGNGDVIADCRSRVSVRRTHIEAGFQMG